MIVRKCWKKYLKQHIHQGKSRYVIAMLLLVVVIILIISTGYEKKEKLYVNKDSLRVRKVTKISHMFGIYEYYIHAVDPRWEGIKINGEFVKSSDDWVVLNGRMWKYHISGYYSAEDVSFLLDKHGVTDKSDKYYSLICSSIYQGKYDISSMLIWGMVESTPSDIELLSQYYNSGLIHMTNRIYDGQDYGPLRTHFIIDPFP